jgi:hypothetical protein
MINCPLPGPRRDDRLAAGRVLIFIVVLAYGAALRGAGLDVETVLYMMTGLGLTGATIARLVVDGQLPNAPRDGIR